MTGRRKNALKTALILAALLLMAGIALIAMLPRPKELGRAETFLCGWEEDITEETLSSALPCLKDVTYEGVFLERDGDTGLVPASEALQTVIMTLEHGTLLELLTLDGSALTPLESVAVDTFYSERAYYDGEPFAWDGTRVWRTEHVRFSEAVLLSGSFQGDFLLSAGVETLYLRAAADVGENDFAESILTHIVAEPPYFCSMGELWVREDGEERFVSALPSGCTFENA